MHLKPSNIQIQDLPKMNSKVTKTLHIAYWPYIYMVHDAAFTLTQP